jgi:MinD superfamily P-loop ATPase
MKVIACSGGKGGTGKTFFAVNLAVYLSSLNKKVLLVDCDAENPNSNFLLGIPNMNEYFNLDKKDVFQFIPSFVESKCIKCGRCSEVCRRHAIFQIKDEYPILMDNLCSSCRLCEKICESKAIVPHDKKIGEIYFLKNVKTIQENTIDLLVGELKVGDVASTKIIEELFEYIHDLEEYDYIVADTSPGAHCDVEFVLSQADITICVTEPTPFGIHDLERIFALVEILKGKSYTIVNRYSLADYNKEINQLLKKYNNVLLGRIPLDQKIMESYSRGIPFLAYDIEDENSESKNSLFEIGRKIVSLV